MATKPSLADRIAAAREGRVVASASAAARHTRPPPAASARPVAPPLLPLATVDEVLQSHDLLRYMRLEAETVHRAIMHLHQSLCVDTGSDAPPPSLGPAAPNCPHCRKGYLVLDSHEGWHVCGSCGTVADRGNVNVTREYDPPPDVSRCKKRARVGVPGVDNYIVRRNAAPTSHGHERSNVWHELQHWNQFVRLNEDQLVAADARFRDWRGNGASREVRIASVLLFPLVLRVLPDESSMREAIRRGRALPTVADFVPAPEYVCSGCGRPCHTRKEARFHCRSGIYSRR